MLMHLRTFGQDIASINAHFDHWQMASANEDILTSSDLSQLRMSLQARLIFSVGCRTGFNFIDEYALLAGENGRDDHPQELLANGVTFIGNWGFGYGDHAALAYSEELMLGFARYLGHETIGNSLLTAKRDYQLNQAVLDPVHEKVLMEVIYYGLPMWELDAPVIDLPEGISATYAPETKHGLDVRDYVLVVNTEELGQIDIRVGILYAVSGQTQAALLGRCFQPKDRWRVAGMPGQVAHGVIFSEGMYSDFPGFDPILTMPVWTQSLPELNFIFEGWDPARFWSLAQL